MSIWNNDSLADLGGLRNIASVGGQMWIGSNPALTSLGLGGLATFGCEPYCWGEDEEEECYETCLQITSNPVLPQCEACDLLDQLDGFTGTFEFEGNQPDDCPDTCD
jgi:hypothetical protein